MEIVWWMYSFSADGDVEGGVKGCITLVAVDVDAGVVGRGTDGSRVDVTGSDARSDSSGVAMVGTTPV